MRIVIDMQGAQAGSLKRGIGRYTMAFAHAILRNREDHEVILALSDLFPNTIEPIRTFFDGMLPQENIRVWYAPSLTDASKGDANVRQELAALIREGFLANLKPSVIHVPWCTLGSQDDPVEVFSIGKFDRIAPVTTSVHYEDGFVEVGFPLSGARGPAVAHLRHAAACIPGTHIPGANAEDHLGISHSLHHESPSWRTDNIQNAFCHQIERFANGDLSLRFEYFDAQGQKLKYWDDLAKNCINLWSRLEEKVRDSSLPMWREKNKPRLAYVSPFPPEKTGIADYSAELVPALSDYYEIFVICGNNEARGQKISADFEIRDLEWFVSNYQSIDRVIYHIGNSYFHSHMFDLLKRCPGVVVLHDFYLGDVQRYREATNSPGSAWTHALYESHGYRAVQRRFIPSEHEAAGRDYPVNIQVLRDSLGVVTHSEFSRSLCDHWYGRDANRNWAVIPLLRVPMDSFARGRSRKALGFDHDSFVIASFGFLGPTKLNLNVLNAFIDSKLSNDERCHLVFVGENSAPDYGIEIENLIGSSRASGRIRITGWADRETYRDYLAAADVSVQLRAESRGETSAAVLDCMNYGMATIVNATGAMAELPIDAVWMLPSEFSQEQLIEALETLHDNQKLRAEVGAAGARCIRECHAPNRCARQYHNAIEHFYSVAERGAEKLVLAIAEDVGPGDVGLNLAAIAESIDKSLVPFKPAVTLYLDVSATCRTQLHTGIERVARALVTALLEGEPHGVRVEPVYLERIDGRWVYVRAGNFTSTLLGLPAGLIEETVVRPRNGDIVLGLDIFGDALIDAARDGFIASLRNEGVRVFFMVHDLLPITLPHTFPPGADAGHARWLSVVASMDGAICISEAVAADLRAWLHRNARCEGRPFFIGVSHHGADLTSAAPTMGIPSDAQSVLATVSRSPTFLMVGTIEPRKGHLQVLDAFTKLWDEGLDANLVVVGNEGWQGLPNEMRRTIPEIVRRLETHELCGSRLFWIRGASDEYLEKIYERSTCLIVASEGEGFGLPLIEGARHKLAIFARDLPVFREVAGGHAAYFSAECGDSLAAEVRHWLSLYRDGTHPTVENMRWLTWKESAERLFTLCTERVGLTQARDPSIAYSLSGERKRLLVDISVVYKSDYKTGIQRVVRAVLGCLLDQRMHGYEVVPVCLESDNEKWCYKSAVVYFDGHDVSFDPSFTQGVKTIVPEKGDVLLGLDLAGGFVVNAAREGLYERFKAAGSRVYFVLYDLLPVTMPQFFSPSDSDGHEAWLRAIAKSDGVICISEATADDFREWLAQQNRDEDVMCAIPASVFHLGADIGKSSPSVGFPRDAETVLAKLAERPTFIMVGTVEPRKGHQQALDAIELLWSRGVDVNFLVVGKRGWLVESLVKRLVDHQERDRRLFWLEGVSDEYLEKLYAESSCLIAASYGEGFGLPLIEAAQHKLPIIARDIAVFREVAGEYAFYFSGAGACELADAIMNWLVLYEENLHPASTNMPWLTWDESVTTLLRGIFGNDYVGIKLEPI